MKRIIWSLFAALALIWTTFAFLAAGLARWTSDAIASDLWAETTQYVAQTSERVTLKVTDATGRVAGQVATSLTRAVGDEQQSVDGSMGAATAPADPILPPLPDWVDDWLAPETVQSIEEWGVWANAAANAGQAAVADAANATARAIPKVRNPLQSTTMTGDLEVEASHPVESGDLESVETNHGTDVADAPWLADLVGWLVPIVWVIWGIGLILGILLTLVAQWGASQWLGNSALKPTSPR